MKKSVIIVLGVVVFCVVIINSLIDNPSFDNTSDLIDYALKSKQYALAEKTYKSLIKSDSLNLDYYYGQITTHFEIPKENRISGSEIQIREDYYIFDYYELKAKSEDELQRDIGNYGIGLSYAMLEKYDTALFFFEKVNNKDLKYLNNSIGYVFFEDKQYEKSELFLLKEIENKGNVDGAYMNLINLYFTAKQYEKIGKLLDNNKANYFSQNQLQEYYFKTGKAIKYLKSVLFIGIKSMDIKSFIAALLIAIVWLIFLRKIDINPDNWMYTLITFFLGILFAYGTFFLSDIINHFIGFNLNGEIVNDFSYCFLGIGLIEETMKLLPFLLMFKFADEIDEPIDYIVYLSISALGFAFAENMLYFHGYGLDIIHGRALISVVIHMFCSSIIGYGICFGFAATKMSNSLKILIFLLVAAFVHGFFDFWLINDKVNFLSILSVSLVFIIISVWNSFINNCLNFSLREDQEEKSLAYLKLEDYLIYSLFAIFIFEYVIVSLSYGPVVGNSSLFSSFVSGTYLIVFISSNLSFLILKRNHIEHIRFSQPEDTIYDRIINQMLTFRKYGKSVNDIFPCQGKIIERKIVDDKQNWYLVKLDNEIQEYYDVCKTHVMIRIKDTGQYLKKGKQTIVGFLLIKNDKILKNDNIDKSELIFIGWSNAY